MSLRFDGLSESAEAFAAFTGLPLGLFRPMLPVLLASFEARRLEPTPTDQLALALVHLERATTRREVAYRFGVSIAPSAAPSPAACPSTMPTRAVGSSCPPTTPSPRSRPNGPAKSDRHSTRS